MTNMKRTRKNPQGLDFEVSSYPYGLTISLEEEEIKKLGIDGVPDAGSKKMLSAVVEVSNVSVRDSNDKKNGGKRRSISLQITDMELTEKKERKLAKDVLFGKGNE